MQRFKKTLDDSGQLRVTNDRLKQCCHIKKKELKINLVCKGSFST